MNEASQQLIRQWKILQALEASRRGCTVAELLDEHEVSDKTIRRDLDSLQAVFPITTSTGDKGLKRWTMQPLSELLGFCLTDLISIHMGRQFLEPLAGTPFWEGFHKVLIKVRGAVGDAGLHYVEKLSHAVAATTVGVSDYSTRGELIDRLMTAIEDHRIALIVYQSMQSTEPVEQEVYPLGMVHHRGSLYLIAWSSTRKEIRTYKIDRLDDVQIQNLRAEVPEKFSLEDWLASSFGVYRSGSQVPQTIRIRFTRDVARYVQESRWHASQQLTLQKDGSLTAEFQLTDTTEIKRWIMSFGPNAQVLEPAKLVEEIAADLTQMQKAYEDQEVES
ncbi:MAG: WYL domain-containing transcriptional regulator [Planctomycetaceae bacterium]